MTDGKGIDDQPRRMSVRRLIEISTLVLAFLMPTHAFAANSWGVDFTDLWWSPAESGWGANIVHQREIIFMTLYAYGADSQPKWYVASSMASTGGEASHTFRGALYEATGPYLGMGTFNPNAVTRTPVGTAELVFTGIQLGTLTYTVGGTTVVKQVERQTFRANDFSGSYFGARVAVRSGCGSSSGSVEQTTNYAIAQSNDDISVAASLGSSQNCTYSGTYRQYGKQGEIQGTFICTDGSGGQYTAVGLEVSDKGFLGRDFRDYRNGCTEWGVFGGVKR